MTKADLVLLGLTDGQERVVIETELPFLEKTCVLSGESLQRTLQESQGRPVLLLMRTASQLTGLVSSSGSGKSVTFPDRRKEPYKVMYYFGGDLAGSTALMFSTDHQPVCWRFRPPGSASLVIATSAALALYSPFNSERDRTELLSTLLMDLARLGGQADVSITHPTVEMPGESPVSPGIIAAGAALDCDKDWTEHRLSEALTRRWPFLIINDREILRYLILLQSQSAVELAQQMGVMRLAKKLRR